MTADSINKDCTRYQINWKSIPEANGVPEQRITDNSIFSNSYGIFTAILL